MKQILKRLRKYLPSLNKKRITWRMVERACRKLNALLYCIPLRLDGYYVPSELSESGKDEIYVNSNLSEERQIATAVHEIKHCAFDYPIGQILFSYRKEWTEAARRQLDEHRRYELEACAMGAVSILPVAKLKKASRGLFDTEDEFLDDLWSIRLRLRHEFGI